MLTAPAVPRQITIQENNPDRAQVNFTEQVSIQDKPEMIPVDEDTPFLVACYTLHSNSDMSMSESEEPSDDDDSFYDNFDYSEAPMTYDAEELSKSEN